MITIENKEKIDSSIYKMINEEFTKYSNKHKVECGYVECCFVAKEDEKIIGLITAHTFYKDMHVDDLVVLEEYRNKNIGSMLLNAMEKHCKDKGFENINLTTYAFQAPEFYKKCGYSLEFIRENKNNPKLSKYFFIKDL